MIEVDIHQYARSRRPSSETHKLPSGCVVTRYQFFGDNGDIEVVCFDHSPSARAEWDDLDYSWGSELDDR